ncbi:MAG TPA: carboxylate-amine ligase [Candidatus Polarisedimenticolia bacterium]|nr:carboxylate-amine ligase [Candidatus Polarisedimenticolia bacterium]
MSRPSFTIGIEEEFQVIDPGSRELRSHINEIFRQGHEVMKDRLKPELHQAVVEVGTDICADIAAARRDVTATRRALAGLARDNGLRIAAAGTHPFSHWASVGITGGNPRYERLIADLQMVARANLIFGLHVHVGVEDRETQIRVMNAARYFLPHILALSVNSPFWLGRETGWMSYRCKVFDKFPRTNIPDRFTSWSEFEDYVKLLVKTQCVLDGRQIWWDIRPHPIYTTLEYRICDIPMTVDETIAIAALIQAITAKLWLLQSRNLTFRHYRRSLIMENKWRAARWGTEGRLIDFGKEEEVPVAGLVQELLEFVDEVVDDLGSRREVEGIRRILEQGTGAERQLRAYRKTGDLRSVMDYVVRETEQGLGLE